MAVHPLPIDRRVVASATAWATAMSKLRRPLHDDVAFSTYVAAETIASAVRELPPARGAPPLDASWLTSDDSWPGVLELVRGSAHHSLLVVAAQSSMEPRPVWPIDIPLDDFGSWDFDGVVAAYVPKRLTLEVPDPGASPVVHACGWLPAAQVRLLQRVEVAPHAGHEFQATYLQARVCDMLDLGRLPGGLADSAGDRGTSPSG